MWVLFGGGGSWDRVLKENKGFTGVWVFGPVRNTRAATLGKTWEKVFASVKKFHVCMAPSAGITEFCTLFFNTLV